MDDAPTFFPYLLQHGTELERGWSRAAPSIPAQLLSSQMVLSHLEVIDTKSSTSSSPPRCSINRFRGPKAALVISGSNGECLGMQCFLLAPLSADLLPVEFLLHLRFLADIKTTWATKPRCFRLHANESREHAKLWRSRCKVSVGFACNLVHPK